MRTQLRSLAILAITGAFVACGGRDADPDVESGGELAGSVEIDGSSTVFPVSEAAAEDFMLANPGTSVTVGVSGTGGGMKRFCAGETDISDASRPITDAERQECEAAGIEPIELSVAWDGLAVVTNPAHDFVACLTTDELKSVWEPGSSVETWRDIRSEWPDQPLALYGPGTDSGTFDYFTEEVVGEAKASRADYQASEDDNVLVQGVAGDQGALGYFGYAYYVENRDRLRLLGVDAGEGCVTPSDDTIEDGTYPLARPLFIYVKRSALERPVVREFVRYYLENAGSLVPPTGYHPLGEDRYQEGLRMIEGGQGAAAPGEAAGESGDAAQGGDSPSP